MIHPTSLSPQAGMTATLLQSSLDGALADDRRTENILRERTRIPNTVLSARLSKDVHITPQEAVDFGIVQGLREFAIPKGYQILQI
jgi:ATP-dependent Clp protease protease subunit